MDTESDKKINEGNKLLLFNTVILNIKTIIVLVLSFLTSRYVIASLGVDGYGLFYLIAGVTGTFDFLCSSLLATTSRFTILAEGKHDSSFSNTVFNTLKKSNLRIIIWILVVLETVGVFLLLVVLNIPSGLKLTSFVVYQVMVVDTYFKMIVMPYNSILIAKENYLIINLVIVGQSILKLIFVLLLFLLPINIRLIVYTISIMFVSLMGRSYTIYYVEKHYSEAKNDKTKYDKTLAVEMFSYLKFSWIGSVASIVKSQGSNLLFNIFTGLTTFNAAYGVSKQITGISDMVFGTTAQAFMPQTIKSYSENNIDRFKKMSLFNGKLAIMLSYIVLIPLFIEIDFVFGIWLVETPKYAVTMTRIIIISEMFRQSYNGITMSTVVNDKVKKLFLYQTVIQVIIFAFTILFLLFNQNDIFLVLYSDLIVSALFLVLNLLYNQVVLNIKIADYLMKTILPTATIVILYFYTCLKFISISQTNVIENIILIFCIVITLIILFYYVLFNSDERRVFKQIFHSVVAKLIGANVRFKH